MGNVQFFDLLMAQAMSHSVLRVQECCTLERTPSLHLLDVMLGCPLDAIRCSVVYFERFVYCAARMYTAHTIHKRTECTRGHAHPRVTQSATFALCRLGVLCIASHVDIEKDRSGEAERETQIPRNYRTTHLTNCFIDLNLNLNFT